MRGAAHHGRPVSTARAASAVLATELLSLARDRRALFLSVLLPVALYPLLFALQARLERLSRETMEAREVTVATALDAAPPALGARARELLRAEVPIALRDADPKRASALEAAAERGTTDAFEIEREELQRLRAEGAELLLHALPHPEVRDRWLFRAYFDGADDLSNEARQRVSRALATLRREVRAQRLGELFGGDPARGLDVEAVDIASAEEVGGAALGRLLPLFAVLVLLSSGSYAALAAFAGERESKTLETLLVQPVDPRALALGKFGAVLAVAGAALALNAASVAACLALGFGGLPGFSAGAALPALDPLHLLASVLVFLPACFFLCAVLCLVCGRARTFREGQHALMPLLLCALVPTLLATRPEVELDPLLACVPLAGPALAFRDALTGSLRLVPGLLAASSSALWAWLALARLAPLLNAERSLHERDPAGERGAVRSRLALRFGWAGVFAVYLAGGLLQALHPLWGLVATLWLVLPILALACALALARSSGETLSATLGLRAPSPSQVLGALLAAPGLARLARAGLEWQQKLLPLPTRMLREELVPAELADLAPLGLLLVFALSPGICEELFFRGAVLGGLRADLAAWKAIAWQALLFGAVHASIYRFLPTALLGALLAAMTLRSRSLWPAVVLHTSYNAVLVLGTTPFASRIAERMPAALASAPLLYALAAAGLLLMSWQPRGGLPADR